MPWPSLTTVLAYTSVSTVGSLLLGNSEFRLFLGDLTTIGREVFRDSAFSLSEVSKQIGEEVAPPDANGDDVGEAHPESEEPPSTRDFEEDAAEVSSVVADGVSKVTKDARASISENVAEDRGTLQARLKRAVLNLRQKPDYNESVSFLSILLRRCAKAYTRTISEATERLEEDVDRNRETDRALVNFWEFITSLGDRNRWEEVKHAAKEVMRHARGGHDFERHVDRIGDLVQAMLTDPAFYDNSEKRLGALREEFYSQSAPDFRRDIDTLVEKLRLALFSIRQDQDISNIADSAKGVVRVLENDTNRELMSDCINTFLPTVIQAIQHIPIPRLEVANPAVDLLLENLILEPGKTTHRSSFFPHRVKFSTQNDVEVLKGRVGTASHLRTFVRLSLSGISISALDVGYWLRYHSGLLRFGSEGLVSVELDQRGIDIVLDLEIGRSRIDELLAVRKIHVRIHKFDYQFNKSRASWLAWILRPLLRPLIRTTIERRITSAIRDSCASVNRELLFARERLRAARVADPSDMWTFIRAVSARLSSEPDPNQHIRVGIDQPGTGVFDGVYAPGSVVKVWNEEGRGAEERVRDSRRDGWRNAIFGV